MIKKLILLKLTKKLKMILIIILLNKIFIKIKTTKMKIKNRIKKSYFLIRKYKSENNNK